MVDGNDSFTTTRRGALKTGAVGLGGLTGAIALGGSAAAAAEPPAMASVAALAGVTGGASYFLQLDGVPGDSVDADHPAWIDLSSYQWGASNTAVVTAAGAGRGRASISALSLTTAFGSASPRLFLRTMNGRTIPTATIHGMSRGDQPRKFLEVGLDGVIVTAYSTSAASETPFDSFSLIFAAIRYSIFLQNPDGSAGETITSSWNVRTGTGTGT